MLRIVTANLNGIRAAKRKGFFDWVSQQEPSIVCVQELKAQAHHLDALLTTPMGWHAHFQYAQKKGYAGVGLYTQSPPKNWMVGIEEPEFDNEGRCIRADFENVSVVSVYFPSGSSSPARQEAKFRFLAVFEKHLQAWMDEHQQSGRSFIVCGDWNIAHREIDLKNWRGNLKNSGFLPEERVWLDKVFQNMGWVDVFRLLNPHPEQYTWWSQRGRAWDKNVGWRIDYQVATPDLAARAYAEHIYKLERFSDHAPLVIDYDYTL